MNMPNIGGLITAVVTLPFILILLVVILVFARSARKANASNRWPMVNGHILSSHVGSYRSRSSNGTHTTMYEPKITYEYQIDGQRYQSEQISFGAIGGASWEGWAEKVVEKYPEGSVVQVFYNPAKLGDAVLEHSGSGGNWVLTLILSVVELILIGILVAGVTGRFG